MYFEPRTVRGCGPVMSTRQRPNDHVSDVHDDNRRSSSTVENSIVRHLFAIQPQILVVVLDLTLL